MISQEERKGDTGSRKFPAKQRLKSKKIIEELFKNGSSVYLYPFRLIYPSKQAITSAYPQVLISVPKRNFKKAVDRNRLRRQIKEAWRLNRQLIYAEEWKIVPEYCIFIYTSKEKMPFKAIDKKLILVLKCLQSKLHET